MQLHGTHNSPTAILEVGGRRSVYTCHNYKPAPRVLQVPRRTTVNASKPPKNATYAAPRQDCNGIWARLKPWCRSKVEEPQQETIHLYG